MAAGTPNPATFPIIAKRINAKGVKVAVGHRQFVTMGEQGIKALGQSGAVIYDVKSMLPLGEADGRL